MDDVPFLKAKLLVGSNAWYISLKKRKSQKLSSGFQPFFLFNGHIFKFNQIP
jgi:hypothetical protein